MRIIVVIFLLSVLPVLRVEAQWEQKDRAGLKYFREWSTENDTSKFVLQYEERYDRKGRTVMVVEPCWGGSVEMDTTIIHFSMGGRRRTSEHRCSDSAYGTWMDTRLGHRRITVEPDGRRTIEYEKIANNGREEKSVYEAEGYKHIREIRYNDQQQEIYSLTMEIKAGDTSRIEVTTAYRSDQKMLCLKYQHNRDVRVDSFFYDEAGRHVKTVRYREAAGVTRRSVLDSVVNVFHSKGRDELHYGSYLGPSSESNIMWMYTVLRYNSADSLVEKSYIYDGRYASKDLWIRDSNNRIIRLERYNFPAYTVLQDTVAEIILWFDSTGSKVRQYSAYGGREEWDYDSTGKLIEHRWNYGIKYFDRERFYYDERGNEIEVRYWVRDKLYHVYRTEWQYYPQN